MPNLNSRTKKTKSISQKMTISNLEWGCTNPIEGCPDVWRYDEKKNENKMRKGKRNIVEKEEKLKTHIFAGKGWWYCTCAFGGPLRQGDFSSARPWTIGTQRR